MTGFNPREPDGEAGTGEVDTVGLGTQLEEQGTDGWGDTGVAKSQEIEPHCRPGLHSSADPIPMSAQPLRVQAPGQSSATPVDLEGGGDSSTHGVPPPRGVTWTSPDAVPIGPRP